MRYLLWKIRKLKEKDLQILMQAWEAFYLALHKKSPTGWLGILFGANYLPALAI